MMTVFRRKKDDEDKAEAQEAESVKATIATAAVKAEAQVLVGNLRATLSRLDKVLQGLPDDEAEAGQNAPHDRPPPVDPAADA